MSSRADVLIVPRPGRAVCGRCWNLMGETDDQPCRACRHNGDHIRAVVALAYAPAGGSLHRLLADYKRPETATAERERQFLELLTDFVGRHEACLAHAAQVPAFDQVVVVPSGSPRRDGDLPLRRLVGRVEPVGARFAPHLLTSSGIRCIPHHYDERRFVARRPLDGESILLIDDVWTTGAAAQSAAAALRAAGAGVVATAVVGRFVNPSWGGIAARLRDLGAAPQAGCSFACGQAPPPVGAAELEGPPLGSLRLVSSAADPRPALPRGASYTADSPRGGRSSVG